MSFLDPIFTGVVCLTLFAETIIVTDLRKQHASIIRFATLFLFTAFYFFFGIMASLSLSFYSGPDANGAYISGAVAATADFVLGALLIAILALCRLSRFTSRCLFYAFTVPGWLLLFWMAYSGIQLRLER